MKTHHGCKSSSDGDTDIICSSGCPQTRSFSSGGCNGLCPGESCCMGCSTVKDTERLMPRIGSGV